MQKNVFGLGQKDVNKEHNVCSLFIVHLRDADMGNNLGLACPCGEGTKQPSSPPMHITSLLYLVQLQVSRHHSLNSTTRTFSDRACTCGQGTKQAAYHWVHLSSLVT